MAPATIELQASATSPDSTVKSVTYYYNGTKLGAETVSPYTYSWKKAQVGTYSLTAVAKDALGLSSAPSAPVNITVTADLPAEVAITAVPAPGFTDIGPETIDLAATVTLGDELVDSVAFYANGNKIATGKSPPYKFAWTKVGAGTYSFYAVATDSLGTPGQSPAVSLTVLLDQPPSVSILSPANGSTAVGLTTVYLIASATSTDETIKSVVFNQLINGAPTKLGNGTYEAGQNAYQYAWKKVPVNSYTLEAVATDSLGISTPSAPISITVNPDLSPTVSIITPISGATYAAPASIGLSAAASSPDVSITSVTYFQGGSNKLSTETTAPYLYTWKPTAAGSYSLTAVATDSVGNPSPASAPVTVNVTSATTSTAKLTKPANGTVVAAPATVAMTATATAPAGVANVGFYAGNTLLGTATASPYQFSGLIAQAGVYYLTAVETDKSGGSITSAPISIRVDTPPSVLVTTPANGSAFIGPATIDISASAAASAAGKIAKVEFFENSTLLGTSTAAPYTYQWAAVPLGSYSLTAEAFDSYGISAFSPAAGIQVVTEQPPAISLSTPTGGLTFGGASNVSLSFNATASSSIAKVEIYRNGALVSTLTGPTSGSTWTFTEAGSLPVGKYSYFARAYDSTGASTDSAVVTVTVAPNLPYITDFEVTDGFTTGALDGQVGWANTQGTANVSSTAYSGSQGIQLAAGSPAATAQQTFAPGPGETIIFCDFYALPTAEASVASSTIFTAEGAQFGFQLANGQGVLQVYRGNGSGGGTWVATSFSIALNSPNQAQSWVRLTARLDFTKETWDIYANGNMIAYDIPLTGNTSTYFSSFTAQGDTAADSFFDDMYVGADNPLFTDANNDGIDDAWEGQYGLSTSANDRYLNISGDGIPVIQDYVNGTSPLINTKVTPPPVQSGLVLDLRADAGVVLDPNGNVSQWLDQGPQGNIAAPNTPTGPQFSTGQINGQPALTFNGTESLSLPYNMMQSASAGEVIGVVRIGSNPDQFNMLWNFGTYLGSSYLNSYHFEDFGSSDSSSVPENASEISQYYIYDTSIDAAGTAIYRYNGFPEWTRTGLTVDFGLYPVIGGYGTGMLVGNIAEVIVYDRALTDAERSSTAGYLLSKYAFPSITVPAAPTDLLASAVSSDKVDLSWSISNPPTHGVTTIMRQSGSGAFALVAQVSDSLGYTDTGLTAGTTYTYQITVRGYAGNSGVSNSSTVTTPPNIADLPQDGLMLWLRSTVGTEGAGSLSTWADQSGQGNNALPVISSGEPQLVENQVNGLPVVRFDGANALNLPPNMFQAAKAGQIIAIVKIPNIPGESNTLWNLGSGNGASYNSFGALVHYDDFGSTDTSSVPEDPNEIAQYYVYDTSIDASGNSIYRYDGLPEWPKTGLTAGFEQYPNIGGYGGGSLVGDIAEVIVYSRVLSPQEQATVYAYLAFKYALPSSIVTSLNSPVVTSSPQASGAARTAFNYQVTATNSPSSFAATGLPGGLSIDPVSGIISGTVATAVQWSGFVTATNSSGTGSLYLTITVTETAPVITSATSATGQVGLDFSYQIVAQGAASYSATGLPPGVNVDSGAGLISGMPTAAGSYSVTLTANNSAGSGTATLSIVVNPLLVLTSPATAAGEVGQAFSYQVTTIDAVTGYSASGLPPGLSIDPNAGIILGAPTSAGIYTVTLSMTTAAGTSNATLTISVESNFTVLSGMLLWLKADEGVVADSSGNVSQWNDQSGLGNNAFQSTLANEPQLVPNQYNGLPAVQFNGPSALNLPYNMISGAQEGEIIAIVKIGGNPGTPNTLWNFGTANGTTYNGTLHYDDFGTSDDGSANVETLAQIGQYYVYDTSIDANGTSIYRYDGAALWTRTGLGTDFQANPTIGGAGGENFYGDIAEVFVYDRVLTAQEQGQVYGYLATRYALPPSVTAALPSPFITSANFVTGEQGQGFSFQVTAGNGPASFTASGLPDGLTISPDGLISGAPTAYGSPTVTVTATNASGSGSSPLYMTVSPEPPVIASPASAQGQVGQPFSYQISASNNPTSFGATGLPTWLIIDPVEGSITGTPPTGTTGSYTIELTATSPIGTGTEQLIVTVSNATGTPLITSSTTAGGQVGQVFNYQITTDNAATGYSASGLPAWLTVDPVAGLISGIPSQAQAGAYNVTITASNAAGSESASLTITISQFNNNTVTSGVILWLEGDSGIQAQALNGVATAVWADQSGLGNNATQSANYNGSIQAPTGTSGALFGHSVVHFASASQQYLELPSILSSVSAGDLFVVLRSTDSSHLPNGSRWGAWTLGQNGTGFTNTTIVDDFLSSTQYNVGTSPVGLTSFNLYNATASTTQWSARLNGAVVFNSVSNTIGVPASANVSAGAYGTAIGVGYFAPPPAPTPTPSPTPTPTPSPTPTPTPTPPPDDAMPPTKIRTEIVGVRPVTAQQGFGSNMTSGFVASFFDGDIAEVILYNRNLSNQERLAVNDYIQAKYNLPGIPAPSLPTAPTGLSVSNVSASSFTLSWNASSGGVAIAGYQVYQGSSLLGTFSGTSGNIAGLIPGDGYNVAIVAVDSEGRLSTASSPVSVTTSPVPSIGSATATAQVNQLFSYQITASNNPSSYGASGLPSGLTIDSAAGVISGDPSSTGTYVVALTATNASGTGTANLTLTVVAFQGALQSLPYFTGFEIADHFAVGPISGQNGWLVPGGSALVTAQTYQNGSQSLELAAGSAPAIATLTFDPTSGETIEFCDFYTEAAAETSVSSSTIFEAEDARFAFQQTNDLGVLQVFWGDGSGGGAWIPTSFTTPLGPGSLSASWVRLTVRLDFTAQTWEIYANGEIVASGIPFISNSSTYLSTFQIQGDAATPSFVDDLYLGPASPLFANVANDGIPDSWKVLNGLDPSVSYADAYTFSPTLTDLQVYELGLNPVKGSISDNAVVNLNVYAPHL